MRLLKIIFGQIIACFLMLRCACGFCLEEEFMQSFSGDVAGKIEKLQIYFETEMYDQASALLDELIARFPEEQKFVYLQAIVDYQRGNYERASNVFVEFTEKFPETPEPYYLLGEVNRKLGRQDLAKEYLAKYCRLVPEDTAARQKLALFSAQGLDKMSIMDNGRQNRQFVEKVGFYGACLHSYQERAIKLINGLHRSWSSMGIDFAYPVDLRGKGIALNLREGGDILRMGKEVKETIKRLQGVYPIGIEFDFVAFQPYYVEKKVNDFVRNLIEAIVIVIIIMLIFLEFGSLLFALNIFILQLSLL